MSRLVGGERIKTSSAGYQARNPQEEESNELNYAHLAADTFQTDHHEYRLEASEFGDFLPDWPANTSLWCCQAKARMRFWRAMWDTWHRRLSSISWIFPPLAALAPGDKLRHYLRLMALPLDARYASCQR